MEGRIKKAKVENDDQEKKRKKKIGKFTIRSHSNPLSDKQKIEYPTTPDEMNWNEFYPKLAESEPENRELAAHFADIGSGFGGLLFALSETFPDKRTIGIEIRSLAVQFTIDKIVKKRTENPKECQNIWAIVGNAMKFTPNYFHRAQLEKMFFLFPDPHFKKSKHKRRIISRELLSEYAYCIQQNGKVYIATDVFDLFEWMVGHFDDHPLFEKLTGKDLEDDVVVDLITKVTEEGKKVEKNNKEKWFAVYRRI